MKINFGIENKYIELSIEHTGQKTTLPKIYVPFLNIDYFDWGSVDIAALIKRIAICGK